MSENIDADIQRQREMHRSTWRQAEQLRGLLSEIRRHNSSGLTKAMQARIDAALALQAEQVHAKPELIEGRHYTSTCGFGVMTYIGETPDIDGYLPTFRLQDGRTKAYSHANLPRALEEFAQQAEPEKPAPGEQPANNTVTLPRELAEMIERTWRARLPLGQDNVVHGLIRLRLILAQQAEPVEPATAQDERYARGVTIEKDVFGTVHIKLGDFDYVQIQYQYPYTDNASQNALAKRIVELLTRPAQTEQQPVRLPERKRTGHLPKEYKTMTVVRAGIEAYNRALDDVAALNAIPIAQTEQHPALYVSAEAFADPEQIGMHATRAPNAVQNMRLYAAPIAQTEQQTIYQMRPHDNVREWWDIHPEGYLAAKEIGRLETRVVYAAPIAQTEQQPERWTAMSGDWRETSVAIHGERSGYIACGIPEDKAHAIIKAHNIGLPEEQGARPS